MTPFSLTHVSPEAVAAAHGPVVVIQAGPDGRPISATAASVFPHSPAKIWEALRDVQHFAKKLPMMRSVARQNDRVTLQLGFKVAFFSVGFGFTVDATYQENEWFQLQYVSGEPRDILIRYQLVPSADGKTTTVYSSIAFDIQSLGWLAKFFLKNHPEIQFGVLPGTALQLVDTLRTSVQR